MENLYSDLNYEFHYLLRTEIEPIYPCWQEPFIFSKVKPSPQIRQGGIPIDHDKRLFRYDVVKNTQPHLTEPPLPSVSLAEWPQQLKIGWEQLQSYYIEQFDKQCINDSHARTFCSQALIGVALVIKGTSLETHTLRVPFQNASGSATGKFLFRLSEMSLLQVIHTSELTQYGLTMPLAVLSCFEQHSHPIPVAKYWQLRLDVSKPRLAPMVVDFNVPNTIFAVYGLAYAHLVPDDSGRKPQQLAHFVSNSESALLTRVIPRLLMQQWLFMRLDLAALWEYKQLHIHNTHYHQTNLVCLSNHQLATGLKTIVLLKANTRFVLGKLHEATKILEIQRDNLEQDLQKKLYSTTKHGEIIWQYEDTFPLLNSFEMNIRKLHHHLAYIENKLTHLTGIHKQWRLQFEERQLAKHEQLIYLGNILIFLIAMSMIYLLGMNINQQLPIQSDSFLTPLGTFFDNLSNNLFITDFFILLGRPLVYGILILVLLLPLFWYFSKALLKRMRCSRLWRWGSMTLILVAWLGYVIKTIMIHW